MGMGMHDSLIDMHTHREREKETAFHLPLALSLCRLAQLKKESKRRGTCRELFQWLV